MEKSRDFFTFLSFLNGFFTFPRSLISAQKIKPLNERLVSATTYFPGQLPAKYLRLA